MKTLLYSLLALLITFTSAHAELYLGLYAIDNETQNSVGHELYQETPDGAILIGFRGDEDFTYGAEFYLTDKGTGGTLNISYKVTTNLRISGGAVVTRDRSVGHTYEGITTSDDFMIGEFVEISYYGFAVRGVQYKAEHNYGMYSSSASNREQYWVGYVATF